MQLKVCARCRQVDLLVAYHDPNCRPLETLPQITTLAAQLRLAAQSHRNDGFSFSSFAFFNQDWSILLRKYPLPPTVEKLPDGSIVDSITYIFSLIDKKSSSSDTTVVHCANVAYALVPRLLLRTSPSHVPGHNHSLYLVPRIQQWLGGQFDSLWQSFIKDVSPYSVMQSTNVHQPRPPYKLLVRVNHLMYAQEVSKATRLLAEGNEVFDPNHQYVIDNLSNVYVFLAPVIPLTFLPYIATPSSDRPSLPEDRILATLHSSDSTTAPGISG
jgi:hypothetical protein